ncbi:MAG: ATP-dependent DNA helicase [Vulcanimicrobiaceae bacterium]
MCASIDDVFGAEGPIAAALPGFQKRPGQVQMAHAVERGMLEGVHTIVEAGTGIGKSLAYLVPALRSGKKVVVSTGTIALQEQLVGKDIPFAVRALGIPARTTLLKGRNHYLCKQKYLGMHRDRLLAPSRGMEQLWAWAQHTTTGDRADLMPTPSAGDWEQVDADADDCVGELCEHFRDCHFFRKRDEARYADLVIVNHALFFLDLAMDGGLLPPYDVAVLDEAHQCERWATAALTLSISRGTVARMLRKLHRTYHLPATFDARFDDAVRALDAALSHVPGERYPLRANDDAPPALEDLRSECLALENWVHANWASGLKKRPENDAEAQRRRDLALRSILAHIAAIEQSQRGGDDAVAWVERGESDGRYEVNSAPVDVAQFLREHLFARTQSVVLTSATLAQGRSFSFVRRTLGVDDAQEFIAASPFDYAAQARLFIASAQVNPKAPDFARRAAPLVEECLERTKGRAFVLFTSYARLREVHAIVAQRLPYPIRMQGELPRAALLEWFRSTPNSVLFATATFWEGIDVVGEALSCVVIDRLPFPSPSDPLVAGKMAVLQAQGFDSFDSYMIPAATVRLKQGFGRLIRSHTDRGVVALLDGRAASTRYGARILAALPPATRIEHLDELDGFL